MLFFKNVSNRPKYVSDLCKIIENLDMSHFSRSVNKKQVIQDILLKPVKNKKYSLCAWLPIFL